MSATTVTVPKDVYLMLLDVTERVGCQFWACDGPAKRPKGMITCYRCRTLWTLGNRERIALAAQS